MSTKLAVIIGLTALAAPCLAQTTYYVNATCGNDAWAGVDPNCPDPNDPNDVDGPKATIQAAIDIADPNDVVVIAEGVYTGIGNRGLVFGGKSIVVRSADPNNPAAVAATTIDAQQSDRVFHFANGEGPGAVVAGLTIANGSAGTGGGIYCDGTSPTIIKCQLLSNTAEYGGGIGCRNGANPEISECQVNQNTADQGAGVYCSASDPLVVDCVVSSNSGTGVTCTGQSAATIRNCTITDSAGSGIACGDGSSPTISGCTIADCQSGQYPSWGWGGGVHCAVSSPLIEDCYITRNFAAGAGGGIYAGTSSTVTIKRCMVIGNAAYNTAASGLHDPLHGGGGGVCCDSTNTTITESVLVDNVGYSGGGILQRFGGAEIANCVVATNRAIADAGGVFCGWCTATLTNCTLIANTTGNYGGGVLATDGSDVSLANCIVWDNAALLGSQVAVDTVSSVATLSHSDVQGGELAIYVGAGASLSWGAGNIDGDPSFALVGDYHLVPGSPCLDTGTSTPPNGLPLTDIDGNPRVLEGDGSGDALPDMGAYEYNVVAPSIAVWPAGLKFFVQESDPSPVEQTVDVRNCGGGTLDWDAVEDCPWLTVTPAEGSSTGDVESITFVVDPSGLSHGEYSCIAQLAAPSAINTPRAVAVELYVNKSLQFPSTYATIQDAIDAAIDGDEVVIAAGVYGGPGNRDLEFDGKAIKVRSADPNDSNTVLTTVIDCQGSSSDKHRGFRFIHDERSDSVVAGLTVINGFAPNEHVDRDNLSVGGAVFCGIASPAISQCRFVSNTAGLSGGGIYTWRYGSLIMRQCFLNGNAANGPDWPRGVGGGVHFGAANSATVTECTIIGNTAAYDGGGIFVGESGATSIVSCAIGGNTAAHDGGGICIGASGATSVVSCTISGNTAANDGGGIRCDDGGMLTVAATEIADNPAALHGGGISCGQNTHPAVTDCTVRGNSAAEGAGIHTAYGSTLTIEGCVLEDNFNGGGVTCNAGSPRISSTVVRGNRSDRPGAGLRFDGGDPLIMNCAIIGNIAVSRDGGGFFGHATDVSITNCTVTGNSGVCGGAMYWEYNTTATLTNCVVWDNPTTIWAPIALRNHLHPSSCHVSYCDIENGSEGVYVDSGCVLDWGVGNENVEPMLVDDGYHLSPVSPCVNIGDPNADYTGQTDIDGQPRVLKGRADMGADEVAMVLLDSEPPADGTLPKTEGNVITLVFDDALALPQQGNPVRIRELGDPNFDVSDNFGYTLETTTIADDSLKCTENGAALSDQTWYGIEPADGLVVVDFKLDVCVLRGDANESGRVTTSDYSEVKAHMGEYTDARYDLNGSGRVTTADYSVVKQYLGGRKPMKP